MNHVPAAVRFCGERGVGAKTLWAAHAPSVPSGSATCGEYVLSTDGIWTQLGLWGSNTYVTLAKISSHSSIASPCLKCYIDVLSGWGSYALRSCINYSCIHQACLSPILNESSAVLQH